MQSKRDHRRVKWREYEEGLDERIAKHKCLIQYDRTLDDIAELLGFSGLSAFSIWFAQRFERSATM